jgi:hypothetical protein
LRLPRAQEVEVGPVEEEDFLCWHVCYIDAEMRGSRASTGLKLSDSVVFEKDVRQLKG